MTFGYAHRTSAQIPIPLATLGIYQWAIPAQPCDRLCLLLSSHTSSPHHNLSHGTCSDKWYLFPIASAPYSMLRFMHNREDDMRREGGRDMMCEALCHCLPGRTGHVHAVKITPEEWARGILAIKVLAGDCQMVRLAGLPKAVKQARRILRGK